MENINLNRTETCFNCKKSAARWSLTIQVDYPRGSTRFAILFCPVCDKMTPEDLDLSDDRTITLPTPTEQPASNYRLTFGGAIEYRESMGPNRPFREAGKRTMKRRYNQNGEEVGDVA